MNTDITTSSPQEIIYIVDDDEAVRDSLKWLLEGDGYTVECFDCAEAFLAVNTDHHIGVLLLDVRMPGMSGLELQEELIAANKLLPIIFITGHGDVSMAVNTMKKGAADFLEKPFDETTVRRLVQKNLLQQRQDFQERQTIQTIVKKITQLTPRERQILDLVAEGAMNKQIGDRLNISIKTVEVHRANLMKKLDAHSLAELVKSVVAYREHLQKDPRHYER